MLNQVTTRRDWPIIECVWVKIGANFDNVLISGIVLCEIVTSEGLTDVMVNRVDSARFDLKSKYNNQLFLQIYCVTFMIVGWFLLINLFAAIIIHNYNKIKETKEIGAGAVISDIQRQWMIFKI